MVEITEENGPFQVALGRRVPPREEGLAKVNEGEIQMRPFRIKPGDVMVRTPLALHRGTPNLTPIPRQMVVMGHVMHWLYTHNLDLTIPRDYYQGLPERVKQLLRCQVVEQLRETATERYINFKH